MFYEEPDYLTWASLESLSPHAFACLFVGAIPSADPGTSLLRGCAPAIPEDLENEVDSEQLAARYQRVYCTLRSGLLASRFVCPIVGQIAPLDAIEYLTRVAYENNWEDGFFECDFFKTLRSRRLSQVALLEAEVESLKAHLKEPTPSQGYSTPLLQWLFRAIDEHYGNYPDNIPKKEAVVDWIVEKSKAEGFPVSETSAKHIAVLLTPSDRKKGGLQSRR